MSAFQEITYLLKGKIEDIFIPMGLSETYPVDSPKSDDDTTTFITVKPLVYSEPSLNKDQARNAAFGVLNVDGSFVTKTKGYYYIFVNGCLWREVVAYNAGTFSEVDLGVHYGTNQREASSHHFVKLILPKQTIGLNSDSKTLETPEVRVAYSTVQWSWQYITSLGGLYKHDPRHKQAKAPTFCQNEDLAKKLLSERAQLIDLDTAESEQQIFIHNPVGIALSLAKKCELNVLLAQQENEKIKAKTHYNSAMLAYQSLFNKKLHKKIMKDKQVFNSSFSISKSCVSTLEYEQDDASAKFLRSGAENIDKDFLIDYLSSYILDENLVELPKNKQTLVNFINDRYQEQALSSIQDDYIGMEAAMRDFASLDNVDYLGGFYLVAHILKIAALNDKSIGAYRDWQKETPEDTQRLKEEEKADQLNGQFLASTLTSPHWFTSFFMPNDSVFDVTKPDFAPKQAPQKNDGSGLFRTDAFAKAYKLLAEQQEDNENSFANTNLKALIGGGKTIIGDLTSGWLRVANLYKSGDLKPHTQKIRDMIISLNKATNLPEFGQMHIKKAANIGDDVVAVMNFKRINNNRKQRRALLKQKTKFAGKNPVTFYDEAGKVLATQDPKTFGSNKGAFAPKNWVETNKLIGSFASLEGELIVVPRGHQYAMHMADPEFKLAPTNSLKLKGVQILDNGLPAVMLAFELFNANAMIDKFNSGERSGKFAAEIIVATYSLAASSIEVATVLSSTTKKVFEHRVWIEFSDKWLGKATISRMAVIGGVGVLLGALLELSDAYQLASHHDMDASFAHATAAVFSVVGFVYLMAPALSSPVGWAIIVIGILVGILASVITDNNLERWASNSPFAKDPDDRCTGDYKIWKTNGNECYQALANELLRPSIALNVKNLGNQQGMVTLEVGVSNFSLGQSELMVTMEQIEDNVGWNSDAKFIKSNDNLKIKQVMSPDNNRIVKFIYTYTFLSMWPKSADVSWRAKLQYRLNANTLLPHVSSTEKAQWKNGETPDKAYFIQEVDYNA